MSPPNIPDCGTLFASTKLPLPVWFLAIYLITQSKDGISSLNLCDYENISFLHKGEDGNLVPQTIEGHFDREVKPHVPDAWIDERKTKTGYEINFTKYFYKFKPLRPLAEIKADILKLEEKTVGLEKAVLA